MKSGVARRDPAHITSKVNLCMFQVCRSKGSMAKVPFLAFFFFGPDMKTEMGVVIFMYLKHSPDYIDCYYIWIHESDSLGSSFFAETPFLAFLALHRERKRCGQVEPSPCYSHS